MKNPTVPQLTERQRAILVALEQGHADPAALAAESRTLLSLVRRGLVTALAQAHASPAAWSAA